MVNYVCAFSQSESGKYFEWIINESIVQLFGCTHMHIMSKLFKNKTPIIFVILLLTCWSWASHFRCSSIKTPKYLIWGFCSILKVIILIYFFFLGEVTIMLLVFLKLMDRIFAAQNFKTFTSSSLITDCHCSESFEE